MSGPDGVQRLADCISGARKLGEKVFGAFLTSGFPDRTACAELLDTIASSGAHFVELGMPFSDPLAEGLPIQRASEAALRRGSTMQTTFELAADFRRRHPDTPLLLMGYLNPILRHGLDTFCLRARESGVDGLIIADLPVGADDAPATAAARHGLAMVSLVAPNTREARLREVDAATSGFVYAVSVAGLTGSALGSIDGIQRYLEHVRSVIKSPLLVGFGIDRHATAKALSGHTDGYIVGSALIREVERVWSESRLSGDQRLARVGRFVRRLRYGEEMVG